MHFKYRIKGIELSQIEKAIKLLGSEINVVHLIETSFGLELTLDYKDVSHANEKVEEIKQSLRRLEIQDDIFGMF